jgi:hypothetical protein
MQLLTPITIAVLAATTAATTEPAATITPAPDATLVQILRRQDASECVSQLNSLLRDAPGLTDYPGIAPWLGTELSKAVAATTDFNLCDERPLSSTATPPPSLTDAWSSFLSEVALWSSVHRDEARSLASGCASADANSGLGFQFEALTVTNKAGCESLYDKYLGRVPTWPRFINTFPDMTQFGVFTTVTPGKTGSTGTGASSTTKGAVAESTLNRNAAGVSKERDVAVAAAAAVLGVVAIL